MITSSSSPEPGYDIFAVMLRTSMVAALLAPLVFRQNSIHRLNSNVTVVVGLAAAHVMALFGLLFTIEFLTLSLPYLPLIWSLAWPSMVIVVIAGGRLIVSDAEVSSYTKRLRRRKVAILGDTPAATLLASRLNDLYGPRVEIFGVFQDATDPAQPDLPRTGLSHLIECAKSRPLHTVLLAMPLADGERLGRVVKQLKALNVDIVHCVGEGCSAPFQESVDYLGKIRLITIARRPIGRYGLVFKELVDRVLAAILIVTFLPLMVFIAIAVRLESPGPILFRQQRYGLNNSEFDILKFRTMTWGGSGAARGREQTQRNDPRTTRVGRFLRRYSLDELPQLLNVLRGEMSLVGPRPHPTVMLTGDRLSEEIVPDYAHRHRVKPGLTGWAQINGSRGAISNDDQIKRRVEYDLCYIENWSIFLDLKILALTPIKVVVDSDGAF
jgi:Undecaprenyl-phosphate glucose phosphotransferase